MPKEDLQLEPLKEALRVVNAAQELAKPCWQEATERRFSGDEEPNCCPESTRGCLPPPPLAAAALLILYAL